MLSGSLHVLSSSLYNLFPVRSGRQMTKFLVEKFDEMMMVSQQAYLLIMLGAWLQPRRLPMNRWKNGLRLR